MEFCKNCDNMYYMKKNDEKKLIYYCKHSNYEDTVGKVNINEYTRYDPTLPHVKTIKCPNLECKSNKNSDIEQDVIYIRVDDSNMKYVYLCYHCNSNWKP